MYNNWLTIASAYATIANVLELPFKYNDVIELFVKLMAAQNNEIAKNDDLAVFWKTVQYLICSNMLYDGGDYKTVTTDRFCRTYKEDNQWKKNEIVFSEPYNLLYLSVSRVFGLYKIQALREGDKPLPDATVEYYLRHSPAFICDCKKVSFQKIDAKSGMQEYSEGGKKKYTSTSAFIFDLDKLDLSIEDNESEN